MAPAQQKPATDIQHSPASGTAVATQQQKPATIKAWLHTTALRDAIAQALPRHMTVDRFVRVALTSMIKTPKLAECTQESMFNCLLSLSQLGLEPDGRRAYLIPFDVRKKQGNAWVTTHTDATLVIGYQGYAELVMRTGLVSKIHADVVCENDIFDADKGDILTHKIDYRNPRGEAYAAYAIIKFKDGSEKTEIMSKDQIFSVRDKSSGWQNFVKGYSRQTPWNPEDSSSEREMWKKTAFRRAVKWVPLSAEIRSAIQQEDDNEDRMTRSSQIIETTSAGMTEKFMERELASLPQADAEERDAVLQASANMTAHDEPEPELVPAKTKQEPQQQQQRSQPTAAGSAPPREIDQLEVWLVERYQSHDALMADHDTILEAYEGSQMTAVGKLIRQRLAALEKKAN